MTPRGRFWFWVCLGCSLLGVGAVPAWAGQTAHLRGVVVDAEDEPIAGARVVVSSTKLQGAARETVSDDQGRFRFGNLPPGRYQVRIEAEGFLRREQSGLQLELDRILEPTYRLSPSTPATAGGVERMETPAFGVDPRRVSMGRSYRPSFTDKVATLRSPQALALLTPGVVADYRDPSLPSMNGGSPFRNSWFLDGMMISDPGTGGPAGQISFDAIEETLVLTSALDAEYGYAMGGVVNVISKRGQDTFDFDGTVLWAPAELRLGDFGERTAVSGLKANLAASGPILPGKLWFNAALGFVDDTRTTPLEKPVFLETPFMQPRQDREFDILGRLTWQPFSWQTFGVQLQTDPRWLTNERQEPLRHPRAERQLYSGGLKASVLSETRIFETLVWRTNITYGIDQDESTPVSNRNDLAGRINLETNTVTINDPQLKNDYRRRVQLDSSVTTYLGDFVGQHEIRGGVQGSLNWGWIDESLTGSEVFLDRGISGPGANLSGVGDPYRVRRQVAPLSKAVSSNVVSAYVQDVWNPWPNLTVRPGVRFDSARAFADGDGLLYNFNWPSPRLGMSWDPFGEGKTAIRAGYFHYADMGNLSLPGRVGRSLETETYEFNPATQQYDIFVSREGGEAGALPGVGLIPPTMNEIVIGASQEVFLDASVHADLIFRQTGNLFEDTEGNVQWNAEGTDATGFLNGNAESVRVLSTVPAATQRYIGLNLVFDKRLSDRWTLFASYTLSRLEGTVENGVGYAFDNPRQARWEYGFLRNDVRHNARVFLTYDLPYGLSFGLTAQYQSGRPYSKLFYNAFYDAYVDRRAPRGYDPVDTDNPDDDLELRLPDQFQVDARLSWRLEELTEQDIWVILEVRNVLNQRPTTAVEERALVQQAAFGTPLRRTEPLRATLGLRYRF